jgi:ADP-heptose:LPS heptosyltransferase
VTGPANAVRQLRSGSRRAAGALLESLVRLAAARAPAASEPPADPKSIFVLRNNDIGDLLAITPLFEALRRRFPTARVVAGVGDWSSAVLRHSPFVSEVLPVNAPWFNKYRRSHGPAGPLRYIWRSPEAVELARHRFEVGIDVLGTAWGALLLMRAGMPYRIAMRGYAGGHSAAQATVEFDPTLHVGRSALRFAEILGATCLPANRPQLFLTGEERNAAERWWAAGEGGRRRVRLLIGPGGGLAAKCWPPESFASLAAGVSSLGDLTLLVTGGPRERDLVASVASAASGVRARSHPEPPDLRTLFALVAASDLVVCNSSMLLHVAAAFGVPALVVLGRAFDSAAGHQAQWGYPGLSRSLGREAAAGRGLWTPAEVLEAVREALAAVRAAHPTTVAAALERR